MKNKGRKKWDHLSRLVLLDSPFLQVYQDRVRLPNGSEHNYFLTKKADIVVVVATTNNDELIMINEYKYAVGLYMLVLPAGHIESKEGVLTTAERELREETGYSGDTHEYLGKLHESPVQDLHIVQVVRIKNVQRTHATNHEDSEDIKVCTIPIREVKKKIMDGSIKSCSTISALSISGLLF